RDLAEMQLETMLELAVEGSIGQRHDALGLARRLRPHDRRAAPLERENGEWACGQKMLLGAAFMIAFVADAGDDGRLIIRPAVGRDAGARANGRARAVGGDQQPWRNRAAIR